MKKVLLCAMAAIALSASQASATTIDFTGSAWTPSGLTNSITASVGGHNVTADAFGLPLGGALTQNSDGLGITSFANIDGDIGSFEILTVSFADPFTLTSFLLGSLQGNETAYYRINGSGGFTAVAGTTPTGNKTVSFASLANVTKIEFGYSILNGAVDSDFRVHNINGDFASTTTPPAVPEPTSLVLLGTGVLGLVARVRRQRA